MSQIALSTLSFMAPAPAVQAVRSGASPMMGMESELGATGPLGYWDPLGFVSGCPGRSSSLAHRVPGMTSAAGGLTLTRPPLSGHTQP